MWKLRCVYNENVTEKVVKFSNIIGRNEIRSFFADNGYAMMDFQRESIANMQAGETLKFYFPNKVKFIEVIKVGEA